MKTELHIADITSAEVPLEQEVQFSELFLMFVRKGMSLLWLRSHFVVRRYLLGS